MYCHFFVIEWFASQTKFKTVIQEMEKGEITECLTMFYAAVRREDGTEFKVSSLKAAIRAAIDRYLRQPPNNKPWSIVGDSAFQKSNKVLNAICKQMTQEGKVGPTIHKKSYHERTAAAAVRNRATRRMGYFGSVSTPPHCMVLHNLLFR